MLFTFNVDPENVKFDSPSNVFAVPDPVMTLLSALLFIVVDVILVKFDQSIAGNVPVNCAAGKLVKDAPEPLKVVEVVTPVTTKPC